MGPTASRRGEHRSNPKVVPSNNVVVPLIRFPRLVRGCGGRRQYQRNHSETMTTTRRWRPSWKWHADSAFLGDDDWILRRANYYYCSYFHDATTRWLSIRDTGPSAILFPHVVATKLTSFVSRRFFLIHLFRIRVVAGILVRTQADTKDCRLQQLRLVPFGIASKLHLSH